ncbi:MAG: hypothetical protein ACOYL6_08745 [Bacteriovoracaceae bacterium]
MKKSILMLLCAFTATALADAGSGAGNGGKSISKEGIEYLKDLQTSSNCHWYSTYDFINEKITDYNVVDNYLTKVNDDLKKAIKTQMVKTSICLTSQELVKVNTTDKDSVFIDQDDQGNQIAIRLNDVVFLNSKLFDLLLSDHKKYLMVHEMLHGLMGAKEVDFRNLKVRSFVANFHQMINSSDFRESQIAVLIKNTTLVGVPLFSQEKSCGVNKTHVFSREDAIQDCLKLYGPFAFINSGEANVAYAVGDNRIIYDYIGLSYNIETKKRSFFYCRENKSCSDWFGGYALVEIPEKELWYNLNLKTLEDYFEAKKQLFIQRELDIEYMALESSGKLTLTDCFNLNHLSSSLVKASFLNLNDTQLDRIAKEAPSFLLETIKELIEKEVTFNVLMKLNQLIYKYKLSVENSTLHARYLSIKTLNLNELTELLIKTNYVRSLDNTFAFLKVEQFDPETRCRGLARLEGIEFTNAKKLKKHIFKTYDPTRFDRKRLKELMGL